MRVFSTMLAIGFLLYRMFDEQDEQMSADPVQTKIAHFAPFTLQVQ